MLISNSVFGESKLVLRSLNIRELATHHFTPQLPMGYLLNFLEIEQDIIIMVRKERGINEYSIVAVVAF